MEMRVTKIELPEGEMLIDEHQFFLNACSWTGKAEDYITALTAPLAIKAAQAWASKFIEAALKTISGPQCILYRAIQLERLCEEGSEAHQRALNEVECYNRLSRMEIQCFTSYDREVTINGVEFLVGWHMLTHHPMSKQEFADFQRRLNLFDHDRGHLVDKTWETELRRPEPMPEIPNQFSLYSGYVGNFFAIGKNKFQVTSVSMDIHKDITFTLKPDNGDEVRMTLEQWRAFNPQKVY